MKRSLDDSVVLIVLFEANYMFLPMPRKDAMYQVKAWFQIREGVRQGEEGVSELYRNGSVAGGYGEGDRVTDHWAYAYDKVIGMYIKEIDSLSAQDRLADAQAEIARTLAKQLEEGEEWRSDA